MEFSTDTLHQIPSALALQYRVIPAGVNGSLLRLYCAEGIEIDALHEELEIILNREIVLETLEDAELSRLLSTHYLGHSDASGADKEVSIVSAGADFLNTLIEEARRLKSSDVHIEHFEKAVAFEFVSMGK